MQSFVDTVNMRRVVTIVMGTAVVLLILSLVSLGLYFKREVSASRAQQDDISAQLESAKRVITAEQERAAASGEDRAAALRDAIEQVIQAQSRAIEAQFAKERAATKAETDRLRADLKRAQDELARKIEAIVSGPAGAPGAPGAPGQPGPSSPTVCVLCTPAPNVPPGQAKK